MGLTTSEGRRINPKINMATELIVPLTTPISALPITMENKLMGDIKNSSKLL